MHVGINEARENVRPGSRRSRANKGYPAVSYRDFNGNDLPVRKIDLISNDAKLICIHENPAAIVACRCRS